MPCYSRLQTVLTDVDSIEKAARELGITVEKHNANKYTLRKGSEHITIERRPGEKKFSTVAMSGSNNWPDAILQPIVQSYAKVRIKQFAAKRGMTVSLGTKNEQGQQYVLTSYR